MKILGIIIILLLLSYSFIPTILGKLKWRKGFTSKKELMLTFDDGPDSNYTPELLDLLKEEEIKASFFLVSEFALENKDILVRMVEDGHTIGLHSRNHTRVYYRGFRANEEDLKRSIEDLRSLGLDVDFYRPPWGRVNIFTPLLLSKYKLKKVLWNVMAEDWEDLGSEEIEKRLTRRISKGSIICLHDGRNKNCDLKTIESLRSLIPKLKLEGYKFVTVGEYYG